MGQAPAGDSVMGNQYYKYNGTRFDEPEVPIGGPGFNPGNCGKPKNYRMHLRYGVPVCDACREALQEFDRAGRARRKAAKAGA